MYITDRKEPIRLDFWRYWVFDNPKWDWRTFDYDRDVAYADKKVAAVNATDPDLNAFKSRGGKVLMYPGWAEPTGPPLDAIDYYKRVEQTTGGRQETESFFRLFMVPGMAHCGGGPGPSVFGGYGPSSAASSEIRIDPQHDVSSALVRWVEKGIAPDYIVASHVTDGRVDRTRPICPFPKVSRWNGKGSTDDAKNFTCVEVASRRTGLGDSSARASQSCAWRALLWADCADSIKSVVAHLAGQGSVFTRQKWGLPAKQIGN